jgi:hypothetical protein
MILQIRHLLVKIKSNCYLSFIEKQVGGVFTSNNQMNSNNNKMSSFAAHYRDDNETCLSLKNLTEMASRTALA